MSVIILISVLLRTVATIWSLAVVWRLRDGRVLWLTAMLVLMTFRQILTMVAELSHGAEVNLDVTTHLDELPGLMVSLIIFLIVLNLEGYSKGGLRERKQRSLEPASGIPILPALTIGLASILGIVTVAYFAYDGSRATSRRIVADANLALARTVSHLALLDSDEAKALDRQQAIDRLDSIWARTQPPLKNSYLCVIGSSGKVELHTLLPQMKGTDVGQSIVSDKSGQTVMQLLRLKSDWSGSNTNSRGAQQLIGYHYEPSIDALIAVHVPMASVDAEFGAAVAPWLGGTIIVGGMLIPLSLGLLFQSSRRANARALASLSAMRESEERFRRLVEHAPFCIHEIGLDGTFSSMNAAGLAMLGVDKVAEVCGVNFSSVVGENDKALVDGCFEAACHGQTRDFEFTTANGNKFVSCFIPLTDGTGGVQRLMGITQDVTSRLRAEEKLRESEAHYRTIFEQAAVGVAQLNSVSGTLLQVNGRYCEILGAQAESIVGKTWMELTHPADLAAGLANMERMRAGEIRDFTLEKRLERRDGVFIWIKLTVSALWQPGEEPTTHIAIVQDITPRKQAEESLRLSEERYRSLVTATAAMTWITDSQGGFDTLQPMWQDYTGQPCFEVLEWVRAQPKLKRLPVVMLTSSSVTPDISRAYDQGVNSYLVKPVGSDAFVDMLKTVNLYWLITNMKPDLEAE